MINWRFWLYWPPVVIGGMVIGIVLATETVGMLAIYGGFWGLLYSTFYWMVIEPMLEKKEEEDESD